MSKETSIVLVTVDSCRYDTAVKANTPNLDKIGALRKGETAGSFTYPAHHTFFIGNLPRLIEGDLDYIPGVDQIWRSSAARPTTKPIMVSFDGPTMAYHLTGERAEVKVKIIRDTIRENFIDETDIRFRRFRNLIHATDQGDFYNEYATLFKWEQ